MERLFSQNLRFTILTGISIGLICFLLFLATGTCNLQTDCQETSKVFAWGNFRIEFEVIKDSAIVGALAAFYTYTFGLYKTLGKEAENIVQSTAKFSERLLELVDIQEKSRENPWLHRTLDDIIRIYTNASRHEILVESIKSDITRGIKRSKEICSKGQRWSPNEIESESKRRGKLLDLINNSEHYIKAVTNTDPTYLRTFWQQDKFSQAYLQANLNAADRGVDIERIFILPESILNGTDQVGIQQLNVIIEPMLNKSKNLKIYYVSEASLSSFSPLRSDQLNQNVLVGDNLFTSMSIRRSESQEYAVHLTIAIQSEVEDVLDIFTELLDLSKPASSFDLFS